MSLELMDRPATLPAFATFDESALATILAIRRRAWERASELGIPTTREEEWKYTDLRNLYSLIPSIGDSIDLDAISQAFLPGVDQVRITFVDGKFSAELSDLKILPGLQIDAFENVPDELPSRIGTVATLDAATYLVDAHLGRLEKPAIGSIAALNTATFTSGALIRIAKNAPLSVPIHILNIATNATYSAPRIFVEVATGAEATLIESYVGALPSDGLTNAVIELTIDKNAKLEHIRIQEESSTRTHIGTTECRQAADSTYLHFNIGFGASLARNDINVFLAGSNLHCRLDGVVALEGNQHHDNHTRLDHAEPHCDSFEVYKHVLGGESTAVFNGKIFVHQDAQKTDAKQTNQTLLLSPDATINTKPQLEIFADDVKCTHGATIGQIRQDALFYARSRGIPKQEAQAILVYAFAAEVIEKIQNPMLRYLLEQKLFEKLRQP